jgi:hypothetical protein
VASAKPPATASTDQSLLAIDRIRETAKWLLTTFGVVGAALLAGTQLSDIGDADGWRLALALFGAVLGFVGVAIAIWVTGRVFTPVRVGLEEISTDTNVGAWANGDPGLLKGQADTVDDLVRRYRETLQEYGEARGKAEDDPSDEALVKDAMAKAAEYQAVESPMQLIRGLALFDRVRSKFGNALAAIGAGIVFAGVGLLLFAYATGSASNAKADEETVPSDSTAGSFLTPTAVTLIPTQEGKEVLTDILGDNCRSKTVDALLLGQSDGNLEIASPPSRNCRAARFTLQADLVALKARGKVNPPG